MYIYIHKIIEYIYIYIICIIYIHLYIIYSYVLPFGWQAQSYQKQGKLTHSMLLDSKLYLYSRHHNGSTVYSNCTVLLLFVDQCFFAIHVLHKEGPGALVRGNCELRGLCHRCFSDVTGMDRPHVMAI